MRKMPLYSKGLLSILLITSAALSSCQKEEKQDISLNLQDQLEMNTSTTATGIKSLDLSRVTHDAGHAYRLYDWFGVGGDTKWTTTSTLKIFENGIALGPAHSLHDEVRTIGKGKFSHWGNDLYFTSSDNTDPRTNGRKYTFSINGATETTPVVSNPSTTSTAKNLDLSRVALNSGNAYHINDWFGVGGDTKWTTTSTLKVFENDKELGAAHSLLSDVVTYGKGKFSHFGNDLYFSSSDNTDPRKNGRKYTYTIDGSSPATTTIVGSSPATTQPTMPGGNIVITVQFSTTPTSASSAFTNLKHEKHSVINFEWDDAVRDVLTAQNIFNGKTFTDGAGNNRKYALAVNTNGRFHYTNAEVGATPALAITYAEGMAIVAAGGDIANHSMYHDPQGSGRNYPNYYISPSDMVKQLEALYFSKTGYRMNVVVVPTNYAGFMQAAHDQGYIAGTTTSAPDSFTLYPTGWVNTGNVALLPQNTKFTAFGRQFTDDWGGIVPTYKRYIDELLSGTSPTVNKYMRVGSHNVSNVAGFTEIINYLQTQSNDRIWVASLREFAEYRAAKALTVKSEQLAGNTLTITLDQSAIGSRIRWRDLTLKIAANANISSVNVTGADGHSANLGNKLINIFKQDLKFGN